MRWAQLWDDRVLVAWSPTHPADSLVRELAERQGYDDPGPLHHHCPVCGSVEHGRPYVDVDLEVSVSRSAGLTAVAASSAGPVGVDIEQDADRAWVHGEALAKAAGVGLTLDRLPVPTWAADLAIPGYVGAVAVVSPSDRAAAVARLHTAKH